MNSTEQKEQNSALENAKLEVTGKRKKRPKVKNGHWLIEENVRLEAKKYKSKTEMKASNNPAYNGMCKLKLSDGLFPNGKKSNGYWTNKRIFEIAKSYSSFSDFMKKESTAYSRACDRGILIECCSHMDRVRAPNNYWNTETLSNEARKYKTINEFKFESSGAYTAARNLGVIDEICQHMDSGYKTTDCVYMWKVSGFDNLYKVGVGNKSTVKKRVLSVCKSNELSCEWSIYSKSNNPTITEKKLLKLGTKPNFLSGDGYTEFRFLNKSQVKEALKVIANG